MTEIKRYRSKPKEIEAIQYNGRNANEIALWSENVAKETAYPWDVRMEIVTLEGVMVAECGDYIIKGIHGEFYPCKPEIFRKSYEVIGEQEGN